MAPTRRALLGATAATFTLAGCTSGGGTGGGSETATDSPSGGDGSTATPTATDTDDAGSPATTDSGRATVTVRDHPDLGEILVGPDGLTLYMFDKDTKGEPSSTCYDGCADNWPPLTVDGEPTAGDDVSAALTTFEREDGSVQVAAAGWPLYYFTPDETPGDVKGQGVGDVWWVLRPDGTPVRPEATTTTSSNPY